MYDVRNEQICFTNSTCTQFAVAFAVEKYSLRYKKYAAKLSVWWEINKYILQIQPVQSLSWPFAAEIYKKYDSNTYNVKLSIELVF